MADDDSDRARRVHDHFRQEKSDYLKAALDASALTIRSLILDSAVGAKQDLSRLLMLKRYFCLESSIMAHPFGDAP